MSYYVYMIHQASTFPNADSDVGRIVGEYVADDARGMVLMVRTRGNMTCADLGRSGWDPAIWSTIGRWWN